MEILNSDLQPIQEQEKDGQIKLKANGFGVLKKNGKESMDSLQ